MLRNRLTTSLLLRESTSDNNRAKDISSLIQSYRCFYFNVQNDSLLPKHLRACSVCVCVRRASVRPYLHPFEESAGGEDVISLLGVGSDVLAGPVGFARAGHAHH